MNVSQNKWELRPRFLWRDSLFVTAIMLMQLGPAPLTILTTICLMIWALRGTKAVVQALSVNVLMTFLNPALSNGSYATSYLKWLLLCVCVVPAFVHLRGKGRLGA